MKIFFLISSGKIEQLNVAFKNKEGKILYQKINITETLKIGSYPIINFNDKCKIENNIFGYEPVGIKLIEYSNGLKLLNGGNKSIIIEKESIFSDNVELAFENNIDFSSNSRIEYAMEVKDAPFESYKDNSEIINSDYFKRHFFFKFIFFSLKLKFFIYCFNFL